MSSQSLRFPGCHSVFADETGHSGDEHRGEEPSGQDVEPEIPTQMLSKVGTEIMVPRRQPSKWPMSQVLQQVDRVLRGKFRGRKPMLSELQVHQRQEGLERIDEAIEKKPIITKSATHQPASNGW